MAGREPSSQEKQKARNPPAGRVVSSQENMLRIVLIRPGSTDYDVQKLIQGCLDIPLNDEGRGECVALAESLRGQGMECIYAPCCEPTRQSAQLIAQKLGLKVRKLEGMQNVNHGLWQGMAIDDVRRKQPKVYRQWQEQPENVCPPEGEMISEAVARIAAAMSRLLRRHKAGVIGLVVAEPLASLVRQFFRQDELGDLWKALEQHGQWEIVEVEFAKVPAMSG
jgi:broad specificity phosphatase PhoE